MYDSISKLYFSKFARQVIIEINKKKIFILLKFIYIFISTFNLENMIKTMLEYHTMIKINKQIFKKKTQDNESLQKIHE